MNTWLFPNHKREFVGKRQLMIGLRTLHLIGVSGYAGLFLFDLPIDQWLSLGLLALVSGLLMLLIEIWGDGIFLFQMRGLAVLLKLLIFGLILFVPQWRVEGFITILLLAGYFSHAPARIRYYLPLSGLNASSSAKLRELKGVES
ncbi:MAG TPA: hypothetical protein VLA39_02640 [Marinobacterium sp.]|nr:hypothetical protein [Marinobacterium sp.]